MTEREYKIAMNALYEEYNSKKAALTREYCLSKAEAQIGDVIENNDGVRIEVNELVTSTSSISPFYYKGFLLKKDGSKRADLKEDTVFPHYIKEVHKK